MRSVSVAERRARLGWRHRLALGQRAPGNADGVRDIARDLVCLHATDPATVYLSSWARMADATADAVERALYEDRGLLRMLAMRRTLFVVDTDEAQVLHAAVSLEVARRERARNEQLVALLGIKDVRRWLRRAEHETLLELRRRGEATAAELSDAVPALRRKVRVSVGKAYEGDIGMASRVLIILSLEGRIGRGRPRGTWISSQYRWAPIEAWLGGPMPQLAAPAARTALMGRWLARFGPGTEADLRWWTGLPARDVRAALTSLGAVEVDLDGQVGYLAADDLEPVPDPGPWIALLPSLDATTMGWQSRDWYLGAHRPAIFDANGNAGPTIWSDGRVVGGWAIREGGAIATHPLEDVGHETGVAIEAEAARLADLIGPLRVYPRFPTPLQLELSG